jgi:hypothetical protein
MRHIDEVLAKRRLAYRKHATLEGMPEDVGSKEWRREYQRRRRMTPEGRREIAATNLKARHGLTLERYEEEYRKQRGRCALCGVPMTPAYDAYSEPGKKGPKPGGATIDHDHGCCAGSNACGKCFRGLLCYACNSGLGRFKDSVELLRKAAAYLDRYRSAAAGVEKSAPSVGSRLKAVASSGPSVGSVPVPASQSVVLAGGHGSGGGTSG